MNIDAHSGFIAAEADASSFERWVKLPRPNFDPICDCITKSIAKEILSLEECIYESATVSQVLPCSFNVRSSFKCEIFSHNFFDLVQFESYNVFSTLKLGHEIEIEMARLFTDTFAEFIDHRFYEYDVFVNIEYLTPRKIIIDNLIWDIDPERESELESLTEKAIFKTFLLINLLNVILK